MSTSLDYRIETNSITYLHEGLSRPECVICTRSAGTFISHDPVGVLHVMPDGGTRLYGRRDKERSEQFVPNGIALTADGRLLIANTGLEGGLWQVDRHNDLRPVVMEVDGRHLYPVNFVLVDAEGRFWVSVSTRAVPRSKGYSRRTRNGYIVLIDEKGARIVADGLGFTNECRLSGDGRYLYVNETFARRVSRFAVRGDGSLGERETFCVMGHGDFPDGGAFDAEGHFWLTSVVSNRIYRVTREGEQVLVFEDSDPAHVAAVEAAYLRDGVTTEMLYTDTGKIIRHPASISFGGSDLRTVHIGNLKMDSLPSFRAPCPGLKPDHWEWRF